MTDPEEIRVGSEEGRNSGSPQTTKEERFVYGTSRLRTQRSPDHLDRESSDANDPNLGKDASDPDSLVEPDTESSTTRKRQPISGQEWVEIHPTRGDHPSRCCKCQCHQPEPSGTDFVRGCSEDLNIVLVVAGLLSAVISAFVIYVQPQLQSDPTEESASLLRVLFKMDDTIFGGDVPQVPRWTGPPRTTVATAYLLYLSLSFTLTCVFWAIVCKQLLDLYLFSRPRGERGGYFRRGLRWFTLSLRIILSSLFFLLLFALLLFVCALSIYLYRINTWIFSIMAVASSFGIPIYFFCGLIVLANFDFSHLLPLRDER